MKERSAAKPKGGRGSADGKGTLLRQVASQPANTPDMYGPMEDRGWDPDGGNTPINVRSGINRKQQMLDAMAQVAQAQDQPMRPPAQTPDVRVQGGKRANY
jgi:hypothetical protein